MAAMSNTLERLRAALRDRYDVQRQVGEGGMATVYLAEDRKHRRQVAIKLLRPDVSASIGAERFLREIETAARLQHPHILPLYDSGSADGFLYYVMPFVEGESLRDLLRREGRLPLPRAAELVREVASGLAHAHGQGIVHRDIKPENIMLSGGHAVVADFGIARAIDASREGDPNLTGAGLAIGTPAYMSPEQATADTVDARSDQYALACVFYEMVSGKPPFSGGSMQAMLTAMLTGPRPRLSAVVQETPPEVDAATQRALASDPAQRFADITAFATAVAQESSGAAAATRESRRWKRLALALPLGVALAAVAWMALTGPPTSVVSGAESMAIVPFSVSGSGLEGVGEGMVDLLVGSLDGVGDIRTVEPRTVVREWRRRVSDGDGDLEDALAVARTTKAASVLTGSIVATGGTARLSAQLYDLQGKELSRASVDGPTDSVLTLSNSLALALLREIWRSREPLPSANASGIRSASMPAIRAYLRGERYNRRAEWDSAQVAFEEAVAADSTFALAWYRLASTLGWKGLYQNELALNASANAVRYADSLPPRVAALLVAYDLFVRGEPAAIDSARAYIARNPGDADGWYMLGEAQFHISVGTPRAPDALREPFDRVLAIDSALTPAAIHPMEIATASRDTTLLRRYEQVFRLAGSTGELARIENARRALRGDDSAYAQLFTTTGGGGLALAVMHGKLTDPAVDAAAVLRSARAVSRAGLEPGMSPQVAVLGAIIAQALGRRDTALAIFAASGVPADRDMGNFVRLSPVFGGYADSALVARSDGAVRNIPDANPFLLVWQGLLALEAGDPRRAQTVARRATASPEDLPRPIHGALVGIDGLATVALGDTTAGLAILERSMALIGGTHMGGFTPPVELRYALLLASRPVSREAGIRRMRDGFRYSPELTPILRYYLGRAYEEAGQPDSSRAAYGGFLRLWAGADSVYAPYLTQARTALQRLSTEPAR